MSFKDKVVLVTSSNGGIGATTAIQFAHEEALIVIVGRNETKLRDVKETCEKYEPTPLVVKADVSIDADVKRIIEETVQKYGRIDVLVNNAGTTECVDIISDNFMDVYDHINNVNLRRVVFVTHLAISYLVKSKGNIVNIFSISGIRTLSMPNNIPYSVAKAGINHFTMTAAMNLAIRVNSISPGPVRTDILDRPSMESLTWEFIAEKNPLKRVSEPEEIAD